MSVSPIFPMPYQLFSLFSGLLLLVIVMGIFMLLGLKIIFSGRRRGPDSEEVKLMQDIHQGFQRIEQRVESLETILLEKGPRQQQTRSEGAE